MRYRSDIDGLRALAVLPVVIYHANFNIGGETLLQGGFLGVDIFFVISGFLISGIIVNQVEAGTYSIAGFYNRRIRRIFPILLCVIIATILFGYLSVDSGPFAKASESAIFAILMVSNFWFYFQDNYVLAQSSFNPLLHTWSLSVEEQFYIAFPFVIIFLHSIHKLQLWLLALLAIISFAVSLVASEIAQDFQWYMLATRAWEILAGSIAFLTYRSLKPTHIIKYSGTISLVSVLLILCSFAYVSDKYEFLPLFTLPTVISTALLIVLYREDSLTHKALSWRPLVYIGLLSYGIYLWHFPVIAGFNYLYADDSSISKILLILATILLSMVSYYLIEQPARKQSVIGNKAFFTILGIVTIAIVSFCYSSVVSGGYPARWPSAQIVEGLENESRKRASQASSLERPTLVLTGDSMAGALNGALFDEAKEHDLNYRAIFSGGCVFHLTGTMKSSWRPRDENCNDIQGNWKKSFDALPPSHIVVFGRFPLYLSDGDGFTDQYGKNSYEGYFLDGENDGLSSTEIVMESFEYLLGLGHKLIFVEPFPEFSTAPIFRVKELLNAEDNKSSSSKNLASFLATELGLENYKRRIAKTMKLAESFQNNENFSIIQMVDNICDETAKSCSLVRDGKLIAVDGSHPSKPFNKMLADTIVRLVELQAE